VKNVDPPIALRGIYMAKVKEGLAFPIIPEDLVVSEDELSFALQEYLMLVRALSELPEEFQSDASNI
jgi:hypothetical protein